MTRKFDVLVDSDALVGLFYSNDHHHSACLAVFKKLQQTKSRIVISNFILNETATVLSHREGQAVAKHFLREMERLAFPILFVDQELQTAAEKLFVSQSKKGTSMTDCANVALLKKYKIPLIFSFDKVYERYYHLDMVR